MQKREEVYLEARRWVDTPHAHQHAILGHGADCWAVIKEPGITCGVLPWDDDLFAPFRAYGEQPSPRIVLGVLESFFLPIDDPQPADIACIQWRPGLPMHCAMLAEFQGRPTLIHALKTKGKVVEHGFVAEWPGLVHSWWRYPGLAG